MCPGKQKRGEVSSLLSHVFLNESELSKKGGHATLEITCPGKQKMVEKSVFGERITAFQN